MTNSIVTQESTLGEVCAAGRVLGVSPGDILAMVDNTPAWAETFEVDADERDVIVTFCREVGTAEIRQSFYRDTWAVAPDSPEPRVHFYSYDDARLNGWPKPEVTDIMRAVEILQESGEWPTGAVS